MMSTDTTNSDNGKAEQSSGDIREYEGNVPDDFIGSQEITRTYSQLTQLRQDIEKNPSRNNNADFNNTNNDNAGNTVLPQMSRSSTKASFRSIPGFFSSKVAPERKSVLFAFLKNWLVISVCILCIFSIYWGALYDRPKYFKNYNFLVVNEDSEVIDGVQPLIGDLTEKIALLSKLQENGNYHVYNRQSFQQKHNSVQQKDGSFNVTQEINKLIHHQKYWFAIYVKPNTTYNLYQALKSANDSYDPNSNSQVSVDAIYETGRDILAMNSSVIPLLQVFEQSFSPSLVAKNVYAPLVSNLSSSEKQQLLNNAPGLLSNIPQIHPVDNLPVTNSVLTAPSQVGMIFLIIITFFQFNFFSPTHQILARRVKKRHFVAYRMISALVSYFVLSLVYSLVSLAFQVDFQKAFGKSGFLVYWMTCFLTMSAVGGANENMALFLIPVFPPVLGFWLLFWVISNISPTFFPIAGLNRVYRYGYAFPLHNASEIFKVIFNNSYKGQLGRNFGILVAWIVINNLLFPLALKFFGTRMAKKAAAGKQ